MTDSTILPGQRAALVDRNGVASPEFYRFFRTLSVTADLPPRVDDLTLRVSALEGAGGTIGNVVGKMSIVSAGILSNGLVTVRLDGDVQTAPALSFYGALTAGAKGWQTYSANFAARDNGDGTSSLDLADLSDSGTGAALVKVTRDAKGRLSGTSAATTDDLSEGPTNLYFTAARVRAAVLTGLSTASSAVITAADTVLSALGKLQGQASANATAVAGKEPAIAAGTTAQYRRGDKTWRDFATDVRAAVLTGLSTATSAVIAATDTVLGALGKLQAQITANTLPAGYIDGLKMVWVSGTALTVTSGAAYIPGSGKVLRAAADIAKAGLSLAAATWYHVYLYDNAGTAAVEIVTTAPAAPYNGTARAKTGDASRRYIGSVRADSSGNIFKFEHVLPSTINYLVDTNSGPFFLLSAGTAVVATTVSAAAVCPATARSLWLTVLNFGTTAAFVRLSNSNGPDAAAGYLTFASPGGVTVTNLALDAAQSYTYAYDSAPSGNVTYHRTFGYGFER